MQPVSATWAAARASGKFPGGHRAELYLPVPILGVLASGADTDFPVTAIADGDRSGLQAGPALTAQGGRGQGVWRGPACFARTSVLSQNFDAFVNGNLAGQGGWVAISGLLSVAAAVPAGKWVQGTIGQYQRIIAAGPTPARFEFQIDMGGRTDRQPGDLLDVWIGGLAGARAFTLRLSALGVTVIDGGGTSGTLGSPTIDNVGGTFWYAGQNVRIVRAVVIDGRLDIYVDGVRVRTSTVAGTGGQWAVTVQASSTQRVVFDTLDVWTLAGASQWARFQTGGRDVGRLLFYCPPVDGGLRVFRVQSSPDGAAWTSRVVDRVLAWAKHDGRVTGTIAGSTVTTLPTDTPRLSRPSVVEVLLAANVAAQYLRVEVDDPGTSDYKPRLTEVECWRRDDITRQVQGVGLNHSSDVRMGAVTARELESIGLRNTIARPGDRTYTSDDFRRALTGFLQPDLRPEVRVMGSIVPGEFVEMGVYGLDDQTRALGPDMIELVGRGRYECQLPSRDPALWLLGTDTTRGRLDELTFATLAASNVPEGVLAFRPDPGQLPVLDLSRKAREEAELLRESSGDLGLRFDNDNVARDVVPRTIMGRVDMLTTGAGPYIGGIMQAVWFDRTDPFRVYFLRGIGPAVAGSGDASSRIMTWDTRKPFSTATELFQVWHGTGTPFSQLANLPSLVARQYDNMSVASALINPDEVWFGFGTASGSVPVGAALNWPELACYDIKQGAVREIVSPASTFGSPVEGPYFNLLLTTTRIAVLAKPGGIGGGLGTLMLVSYNFNILVPTRYRNIVAIPGCTNIQDAGMIEVQEGVSPWVYLFVAGIFTDSAGLVVTKVFRWTRGAVTLSAVPPPTLIGTIAPFAVTKWIRATNVTTDQDLWGIGSTEFPQAGGPTTHQPVRWTTTQALATATIGATVTTSRGAAVIFGGKLRFAVQQDSHTLHTLEDWDGTHGGPSEVVCYLAAQRGELYRGLALSPVDWYDGRPMFAWGASGQHSWILPVPPDNLDPTSISGAYMHGLTEHTAYELGGDSTGNAAIDTSVQTITPTPGQVVYTQEAYALSQTEKTVRLTQGVDPFSLAPGSMVSRRSPRFPKIASITVGQQLLATIAVRRPARFRVFHPDYTDLDGSLVDADSIDNPYLWDLGQGHNVALGRLIETRRSLQWAEGEAPWWPEVEVGDPWIVTVQNRGIVGTYVVRSVNLGTGVDLEGATLRTTVDLVLVQ